MYIEYKYSFLCNRRSPSVCLNYDLFQLREVFAAKACILFLHFQFAPVLLILIYFEFIQLSDVIIIK